MRFKYLFILVLLLSSFLRGFHYNIKNYSIEQGLAQSQVYSLCQAKNGFLWIGTLGGGVSRFDGSTFTNFTTTDGLVNNQVLSIFEDSNQDLWFGTEAGICRFDGQKFQPFTAGKELNDTPVRAILESPVGTLWFGTDKGIRKYDGKSFSHFSLQDGPANDTILSMRLDCKGHLWFGTAENGLFKYDESTVSYFSTADGLVHNTVYSIFEDRKGTLWFGTSGGVSGFDGKTFRNFTRENGLSGNVVKAIQEDRDGNLWFGTNTAGICIFDGNAFTTITEKNGLSSNVVWALLEDREGNTWIGTYRGGLDKYSGGAFSYLSSKDGLPDDVIRCIREDRVGNLWFGTFRGGVAKFDGSSITTFTTKNGLIHDFVLTIFEDRKGNLWLGTYGGLSKFDGKGFLNFTQKNGLPDNIVRSIIEDRQGNIWIGTNEGGICKYDGKTFTMFTTREGLTSNRINTLLQDRRGIIWIGTLEGLCNYDGKTFIDISRVSGLNAKPIYCILEDKQGHLWLGAYGVGIIKYNPADDSFQMFQCLDNRGQINTNVVSLCFDNSNQLWIGTEKGICRLDVETYEKTGEINTTPYGKEEGFSGIECIHNSIGIDRAGNIWFGSLKGAIKYNPRAEKPNIIEPMTHITGLRFLFGGDTPRQYARDISPKSGLPVELRLPYNKNYLVIDYIGLSFTVPEKVKYRYRLEGFDNEWLPVTKSTYANYSNLPPGKYTFKVKACNNDGIWNKESASITFKILPPFWRTWLFYILYAVIVILGIVTLVRTRTRNLEKQQKRLEKEVESSTKELKLAKEKVEKINLELEYRVVERTSEHLVANKMLQEEIKDRKLVEMALRESEEKFRMVVENAEEGIFILQDDAVKFPNPNTIEMLGYPEEELAKTPFSTLVHPKDRDKVLERCSDKPKPAGKVSNGTFSFRIINKSGKELWVELNSVGIQWEGKQAALHFIRDITERKRLESQLLEAEKMKAIGTMAGGIAHDFNNVLMGILGNVSLVLLEIDPQQPYYTELKSIEQFVRSGVQLTNQLLSFAKGGKLEVTTTDLNREIKNSAEMFSRTRKQITIHEKFDENLWTVEADRGQIEQVLLNLYLNAWQAMPHGGDLYLQTTNITLVEAESKLYDLKPGNYVKISVTDTGIGMDEATRLRIFEPFFSTKEVGKGTGLGLASVYSIIKNHHGAVQVYSEKGKGTTFNLYLPASEKRVEAEKTNLSEGFLEGTETILLVDDEEMVSNVGKRLLKKLGYTVLVANSGKEAVETYKQNPDQVHLVILDLIMPGMGGEETYMQLKEVNPRVKVLISSGCNVEGQAAQLLERGCKGFIPKPFHLAELSHTIRSILESAARTP